MKQSNKIEIFLIHQNLDSKLRRYYAERFGIGSCPYISDCQHDIKS